MKKLFSFVSAFLALALVAAISSCDIGPSKEASTTTTSTSTTTTILAEVSFNFLTNGGFDSHNEAYLHPNPADDSIFDPDYRGNLDVWTDWVETQIRPATGFTSLFDFESTSRLSPLGRVADDLHAATVYSDVGDVQTTLTQAITISAGTYNARVWVLGGYTDNTFILTIKQGSIVRGSVEKTIDNSDLVLGAANSASAQEWEFLEIDVVLEAGQTEFIIENSMGTSGSDRYARIDDASLAPIP